MKISSKGRYAVRVMAELAKNENEYISVATLSEKQDITSKYLEQILAKLVKANLVESTRGVQGGYRLKKPAKEYSIADILKVTGDLPELVPCIAHKIQCPRAENCDSIGCWDKLSSLITNYLSSLTLDDLVNKKF